jgi:hypothetical protein
MMMETLKNSSLAQMDSGYDILQASALGKGDPKPRFHNIAIGMESAWMEVPI